VHYDPSNDIEAFLQQHDGFLQQRYRYYKREMLLPAISQCWFGSVTADRFFAASLKHQFFVFRSSKSFTYFKAGLYGVHRALSSPLPAFYKHFDESALQKCQLFSQQFC
jgi:hypothetical protein